MQRSRILVVEDDVGLQEIYRILLLEHEVVIAPSLAAARRALDGKFDVLIANWNLPDGTVEALLRESARRGSPPHRLVHSTADPDEIGSLLAERVVHAFFPAPSWREVCGHVTQHTARLLASNVRRVGDGERRLTERVPTQLSAFIHCQEWSDLRQLYTDDLSHGGLSLQSSDALPTGSRIGVALVLPDGTRLRLSGEVRNARPCGQDGGWKIGVRLERLNERKRVVLRAILRQTANASFAPHAA